MNWINALKLFFQSKSVNPQGGSQQKLILLLMIPCLVITIMSLFLANISPYLIAFILILLLLLASFVIVASKQSSQYQIRTLSSLIESMIDGDYSLRGRLQTNQAFQELLNSINELAETLSRHKLEIKESRILLERIMEQMDAMVIATNEQGYVVMANASANKLILNDADDITRIQLGSLAIGKQMLDTDTGIINVKTSPINQISGEHFLSKESFLSNGRQHQLYIMTNAERLLMEKERKAWQGLIRVLNHEMNNSLTPVIAISQSMQKKLQAPDGNIDKVLLLNGVNIINERADSLSQFIDNFSQLSHLPKPNKSTFSLTPLIDSISTLYPMCTIDCMVDSNLLVQADKNQFEQVLINLIKNAIEAMNQSKEKQIEISAEKTRNSLDISIRDHGVGITNFDNIFVPFYTTKTQGSGIGLALCRQIMFNHNGTIKIDNYRADNQKLMPDLPDNNTGVEVTLSLPSR
jgi:nitrogen fixation/metabolism regulation signal transduction histidine kinase